MLPGLSFLNTPTYILAGVVLVFCILSQTFAWAIHTLEQKIYHRKGLLAAARNMTQEIMLVGAVSLFLTAVQDDVSSICVSKSSYYDSWTMNSSLNNYCEQCACDSDVLSWQKEACYEKLQGDVCIAPDIKGRRLLNAGDEYTTCEDGYIPLLSAKTLNQAHTFIFCVAVSHIIVSAFIIWLASLRVYGLNKRISSNDDKLLNAVKSVVSNRSKRHDHVKSPAREDMKLMSEDVGGVGAMANSSFQGPRTPIPSEVEQEHVYKTYNRHFSVDLGRVTDDDADTRGTGRSMVAQWNSRRGDAGPVGESSSYPGYGLTTPFHSHLMESTEPRSPTNESLDMEYVTDQDSKGPVLRCKRWPLYDADTEPTMGARMKREMQSFFRSLVKPLTAQEFKLMRSSFYFTHHPGPRFDFELYVRESLEEDVSKVVGLTPELWVLVMALTLAMGPATWLWDVISMASLVLVLVVNTRLASIVRTITKNGIVRPLNNNLQLFWGNKPTYLLHIIRSIIFVTSLFLSHMMFLAWQIGTGSCYWKMHASRPVFWIEIPVTIYLLCVLALVTLPVYSIVVLMSDQYKRDLLKQLTVVVNEMDSLAEDVRTRRSLPAVKLDRSQSAVSRPLPSSSAPVPPRRSSPAPHVAWDAE